MIKDIQINKHTNPSALFFWLPYSIDKIDYFVCFNLYRLKTHKTHHGIDPYSILSFFSTVLFQPPLVICIHLLNLCGTDLLSLKLLVHTAVHLLQRLKDIYTRTFRNLSLPMKPYLISASTLPKLFLIQFRHVLHNTKNNWK